MQYIENAGRREVFRFSNEDEVEQILWPVVRKVLGKPVGKIQLGFDSYRDDTDGSVWVFIHTVDEEWEVNQEEYVVAKQLIKLARGGAT
jgi:hypothetical protein